MLSNNSTWTQKPIYGTPLDRSNSLSRSLGACFTFNEGAGSPVDLISGSRITLSGTTLWSKGTYGSAFGSDGSTGYGTIALPTINNWSAISIAMIWNCPSSGSVNYGRIIEKGSNNEWMFSTNSSGSPSFAVNGGVSTIGALANLDDGNWHHLVGTYDGSSATGFYCDGVSQGTATNTFPSTRTNVLSFFQYGGGGYITASVLAGLWIYNRILSSAEVLSHMNSPWQMFVSPISWLMQAPIVSGNLFFPANLSLGSGGPFFNTPTNS
jgi:concanavalin A-like lectin/glucanase superfamily protein